VDLDDIRTRRPAAVLVPSEPYVFEDHHLADLADAVTMAGEPPVPVLRIDGQDLFWWGTRTPGAVERLRVVRQVIASER
jgi:hypothetical protein